MLSRTDSLSDQDGRCIGKAREEADKQAFNGPEYRHCRDGRFRLMTQHDIHDHAAHADQDLVRQDRRTFQKEEADMLRLPAEMPAEMEQVGIFPYRGYTV